MSLPSFGQWKALLAPASRNWLDRQIDGLGQLPYTPECQGLAAVREANKWVNRNIRYKSDGPDHWQQPSETLQRRAGDCEDYAILKRAILLNLGWEDEDLILVLAHDILARQDHAMLLVAFEGRWWMLDNRTEIVQDASRLGDYKPIVGYCDGLSYIFGRG